MNFLVKEERSIFRKLSNYLFQWANSNEQKIFRRKNFLQLAYNVPMLELVAAWEPSFFHQVGAKLGKRNEQFTEKLAMKF